MKLTVARERSAVGAIVGMLAIDDAPWCFTLERDGREIPAGSYRVVISESERVKAGTLWSPHEPYLPELLFVPHRTGIRIHAGNAFENTQGCILVGLQRTGQTIAESRKALTELMKMIEAPDVGECWIEIAEFST